MSLKTSQKVVNSSFRFLFNAWVPEVEVADGCIEQDFILFHKHLFKM